MTTLTAGHSGGPARAALAGRPRSRKAQAIREWFVRGMLIGCASFSILTTFAIIAVLLTESVRFFGFEGVSLGGFLTGMEWNPLLGAEKHFGIWPLLIGTLMVGGVAMAFAIPVGLLTAIYLSEYAPRRVRAVLKPVLEILAGVPTVVYGFFAVMVITPALRGIWGGIDFYNALSAGLAVGIMCLPIICSLTEDALQAVPRSLREGAYALGSTKFDVSVKVVTPAALSGIVAAFLLAVARAVGETMIVALAAGNLPLALNEIGERGLDVVSPAHQAQTMTAYMVQIFLGDVSNYGVEYYSSYAVGATLFCLTMIVTIIGARVRARFREAYE